MLREVHGTGSCTVQAAVGSEWPQEEDDLSEEDFDDNVIQGLYWKHVSSGARKEFDRLENIGDLACILLHGHVVHRIVQGLRRAPGDHMPPTVVSELAARCIAKVWKARDLSALLRTDYDGLVDLLVGMLTEIIIDDECCGDHTLMQSYGLYL